MRNRAVLTVLTGVLLCLISLLAHAVSSENFGPQKRQAIPSELKPPQEDLAQIDELPSYDGQEEKPYFIPMVLNDSVENHIEYFKSRGRDIFQQWLNQSARYIPVMKGIFREKGLPEDLVYVAMIESGFNPYAVSWAKAVGPWQFMPHTGKLYNLRIDWWVDERKDPIKSTNAAADHLKDLYNLFGSWPLALASYNAGAGRVQRAVLKSRSEDFWDLKASRYIRKETKNYIPKYMAATIIAKNPEAYGFSRPSAETYSFDEVELDGYTDLRVVAQCSGITYRQLKELNPSLRRWITPPQETTYALRIPKGTRETFLANYSALPRERNIRWERHLAVPGDTLQSVARLYHSTPEAIRDINGIQGTRLKSGKHLLVPIGIDGMPIDLASIQPYQILKRQEILYRVKRGETLSKIARMHQVSVADIREWNKGIGKTVRAGQKIKLVVDVDQI